MKACVFGVMLFSSMSLLGGCTLYSSSGTTEVMDASSSPGYTSYTIGYAGYGGDGTYGSYNPSYWRTSYQYDPFMRYSGSAPANFGRWGYSRSGDSRGWRL